MRGAKKISPKGIFNLSKLEDKTLKNQKEQSLVIFEFGDPNKLVYFTGKKYCITGNQCKNVAFCKAEKTKHTSLSSRQT